MAVRIYACLAPTSGWCFVAAALAVAGCGGVDQATSDGDVDAGPDSGTRSPPCTAAEDCDDAEPCTADSCDSELGCLHRLDDEDGDGYAEGVCVDPILRGDDCNNTNETVYPGAPELCDELDNDCNDTVDDEVADVVCSRDADGDGFGWRTDVVAACNCPDGYIPPRSDAKFDCDDKNTGVNPGHTQFEYSGYCSGVTACEVSVASYDWDCSGDEEMEFPTMSDGSCRFTNSGGFTVCRGTGWVGGIPDCGDSDSYRSCRSVDGCRNNELDEWPQGCR